MAFQRGNTVAKYVINGSCKVGGGAWVALCAAVNAIPLEGREWIELQVRGPASLAIAYTNRNADGTFTSPTYNANHAKIIPQNSIKGEPLGDTVMMWGRSVKKAGATAGGVKVVVTEYR